MRNFRLWMLVLTLVLNWSTVRAATDPVYQWHTFLSEGASASHRLVTSTFDKAGNLILVGVASKASNGPGNKPPLQVFTNTTGGLPLLIVKIDADGNYLWHTFLGRASTATGRYSLDVATDEQNNIVIDGTSSSSWTGPFGVNPLRTFKGGTNDGFVMKLNSSGSYQWHSFFGASQADLLTGVAVDRLNNIYVTGNTNSVWEVNTGVAPLHLPGTPPTNLGLSPNLQVNAFVIKLDGAGAYAWHTFYGPSSRLTLFNDIAVKEITGGTELYVAGTAMYSWSGANNAAPKNPISDVSRQVNDAFILKLRENGAYQWHTFHGSGIAMNSDVGAYGDPFQIALGNNDGIYLAGIALEPWMGTGSTLPKRNYLGGKELYVSSFNQNTGAYAWHTYFGTNGDDFLTGFKVDSTTGSLFLTAQALASWENTTALTPLFPYEKERHLNSVAFELTKDGALQWHAFLGGVTSDILVSDTAIFVSGNGATTNLPKFGYDDLLSKGTPAPKAGQEGEFVVRFNRIINACLLPTPTFAAGALTLPLVQVGTTYYCATLNLVATSPAITLQLAAAEVVTPTNTTGSIVYQNGRLQISALKVGADSYDVELTLVPSSNPLRFEVSQLVKR
jgi:hypothetical protein